MTWIYLNRSFHKDLNYLNYENYYENIIKKSNYKYIIGIGNFFWNWRMLLISGET